MNILLELCYCGRPEETFQLVKELLERAEQLWPENLEESAISTTKTKCFYDDHKDASKRWVEFGAKVLDMANLLEHGGGIGHAWLTPKGVRVLQFLRQYGTDHNDWPNEELEALE